jgi:hypothetical protein
VWLPQAVEARGPDGLVDRAGEQLLALNLVQAAPDPVGLTDAQGVLETGPLDGTGGTDRLGPAFTGLFLVLALEMRRRKEDRGVWPAAGSLRLPKFVYSLNTQRVPPFLAGKLLPFAASNKG